MKIICEISLGELVDKLSILKIKMLKMNDPSQLIHVKKEASALTMALDSLLLANIDYHLEQMQEVNLKLWEIEDDIRELEKEKKFNQDFVELARLVYKTNDERFKRKNIINTFYGSGLVEVKSYKDYSGK